MEQKRQRKVRSQGSRNRTKGHDAERLYMKAFKEMGFDKCVTARYGSHLADDAKIDLMFIPVNVQIKAGYAKGLNHAETLKEMNTAIKATYPAHTLEYNAPNILIHHKDVGMGNVRTQFHSIVSMTFETFQELFRLAYLKNEKTD